MDQGRSGGGENEKYKWDKIPIPMEIIRLP